MLLKPSNFLILDEPTNHLDMNSKSVLMKALHDYKGTLLIISHDREFLDGIVNKIIEVKDNNIKVYLGNCSYYLMKKTETTGAVTNGKDGNQTDSKARKTKEQKRLEAEARNQLYNIAKPLKDSIHRTEKQIKKSEERIKEIEKLMASEEYYKDQSKVKKVNAEYTELKKTLTGLYHDWMKETNKLNKLEQNS
jgi:ATP-binding cassette subfamily F protein 3